MKECLLCKMNLVQKVPIFNSLDDNDLHKIINKIRRKTYQKGDVIFLEGDFQYSLYH